MMPASVERSGICAIMQNRLIDAIKSRVMSVNPHVESERWKQYLIVVVKNVDDLVNGLNPADIKIR